MEKKSKANVITIKGVSIDGSIEGDENLEMLAGWWRVFHQSTDHLMIGKLIIPTKDNIAAYLSPLVLFSNELDNIIIPKYKNNKTNSEVSLASQTHQVPQVGLPQIEPVIKVARVREAPRGARALDIISASVCLKINEKKLQIAIEL